MNHRPTDLGRFSDPAFAILTCLADGPKHGYAMIAESRDLGLELGLGTLYGALNRLERLGLIEALPAEDRRRPYRLTPAGSAFYEEELERLGRVVQVGRAKLGVAS
ncbi:MAG: PadR family transcriptional regulator [Thermomicrobiales bacterium]